MKTFLRRSLGRLTLILVLAAVFDRARNALRGRHDRRPTEPHRRAERGTLASLTEAHPAARTAPRRRLGVRSVPLDQIVGTVRNPSQNSADFRPLPRLRGENWRARWQRITKAMDKLEVLPPIEVLQVGEEYYVVDGHNRVAAALMIGGVEIDADVTQLLIPGLTQPGQARLDAGSLIGANEVRQAGQGRQSRMVEQRGLTEDVSRRDLAGPPRGDAPSEPTE
ncbi:MAG: hypothetical protein K5924_11875 [Chloroflexi bacterium]|nr:hypothetical protein [Chloroflexota bacterium]